MAPVTNWLAIIAVVTGVTYGSPSDVEHLTNALFVFRDSACEADSLHLRCPHGTAIDVQSAQYGRQVPGSTICPSPNAKPGDSTTEEDTKCLASSSLKDRLKKTVKDLCQDQRQCKVTADTETFGQDPCPRTTKYLEVSYKCKPNEFQTRVTCEGEEMILKCQKNKRIAVLSAMFGRSDKDYMECPAQKRVGRICESGTALKKLLEACHGHKHCSIASDTRFFGDPCVPGTPKYLRVVFTCVPKRIMKDTVSIPDESDEYEDTRDDGDYSELIPRRINGQPSYVPEPSTHNFNPVIKRSTTPSSPATDNSLLGGLNTVSDSNMSSGLLPVDGSAVDTIAITAGGHYIGFVTDWIQTIQYLQANNEKLILYIVVGVLTGCLLIMLIVVTKLVRDKRKKARKSKFEISENEANCAAALNKSPCQTTLNLTPTSENTYSHHITTPADTFLNHCNTATEVQDTIDIMQYNLRSLTSRPPTLSRPAPSTLSRAHFRDPQTTTFHSDPAHIRNINNYYG